MKTKRHDITGLILAGGKSSRMNTEKSLLKLNGTTLIERTIDLCQKYFCNVLISTNEPARYEFLNLECVADIYPRLGPISGIHAGLVQSKTEKIFVLSADLVFEEEKLIEVLINQNTLKPIVLPTVGGIPQYTFGLYSKSVIAEIESMIHKDAKPTPKQLIKYVETELIDFAECVHYNERKFININSPTDYEFAKQIFENEQ